MFNFVYYKVIITLLLDKIKTIRKERPGESDAEWEELGPTSSLSHVKFP